MLGYFFGTGNDLLTYHSELSSSFVWGCVTAAGETLSCNNLVIVLFKDEISVRKRTYFLGFVMCVELYEFNTSCRLCISEANSRTEACCSCRVPTVFLRCSWSAAAVLWPSNVDGIHTLLSPWSRVLLEKLIAPLLLEEFPAWYGTRRFSTVLTEVTPILKQINPIHTPPPQIFL
jgi:hypothetical protein